MGVAFWNRRRALSTLPRRHSIVAYAYLQVNNGQQNGKVGETNIRHAWCGRAQATFEQNHKAQQQ